MMKTIVLMMAVLLVGGLFAGSAFAQDADVIGLSPAGLNETSLMPDFECLSEIDFEELGLSEALIFPSLAALYYGFEQFGGVGMSGEGPTPRICFPHWWYDECYSCTNGRLFYRDMWCLGIRIYRRIRCVACG